MGYRSEVAIAIEKELLENEGLKIKEDISDADEIILHDGYYYIYWYDIKWYTDYPSVKNIESFLNEYPEKVAFMRLGENLDDIERHGDAYNHTMAISRSISIPEGKAKEIKDIFVENSIKFIKATKKKTTKRR